MYLSFSSLHITLYGFTTLSIKVYGEKYMQITKTICQMCLYVNKNMGFVKRVKLKVSSNFFNSIQYSLFI